MASRGNKKLNQSAGTSVTRGACVVIVHTEWNAEIVDVLKKGCTRVLKHAGIDDIRSVQVPGAVEIPFAIRQYWEYHKYRDDKPLAFIALGCVVRGGTPHFEYVCRLVTDGIGKLNLLIPVPSIFGVLTVDNEEQARERIGGIHGHKGEEAALTALKMIELIQNFQKN